jgi:hypothetical protein
LRQALLLEDADVAGPSSDRILTMDTNQMVGI